MLKYIGKRLVIALIVLIGITIIDFTIMTLAGSPLEMIQSARVSKEALEVKEAALGLDDPVALQYLRWLAEIGKGNLGISIKSQQPVAKMLGFYLGPTLLLMGSSLLFSLIIAVPAGIYSAIHQNTKRDYVVVSSSFLGSSIPAFFLGLILIYLFSIKTGWLPSSGMRTLGMEKSTVDLVKHLIMPVLVLGTSIAGSTIRYIRSAMLEILKQDYIRTAKAKGIGRFLVIYKHGFRNALLSVVTVVGMQIPLLFGGAIIVEQIFSWPGLGLMTMSAILNRDYPVIMGVCLLTAVVVLLSNMITDLVYALVDPTIQLDKATVENL